MKPEGQVKRRLQAEEAACETDTTLFKNDYVQGYMDARMRKNNWPHKHCSRCGWPIFLRNDKAFTTGICDVCRKAMRDFEDGKLEALED